MFRTNDPDALLAHFTAAERVRASIDEFIANSLTIPLFCSVCRDFTTGFVRQPENGDWVDLRDTVVCDRCLFSSRFRLLIDHVLREAGQALSDGDTLLFERVTLLHDWFSARAGNLMAVEFGGAHLAPGASFEQNGMTIRNEDMQRISFDSDSFDLVVHADVLEHVPDPFRGMSEVFRVLRPGGRCVFACPVYTQKKHQRRAYLDSQGELLFTNGPVFHGDPLRAEGVPVFYEFGLELVENLAEIGFEAEMVVDHSICEGYVSNNNPYSFGLMWPIIFSCRKPAPSQ